MSLWMEKQAKSTEVLVQKIDCKYGKRTVLRALKLRLGHVEASVTWQIWYACSQDDCLYERIWIFNTKLKST